MTTQESIKGLLSRVGHYSERDLFYAVRSELGAEPDDFRDVIDELVDLGVVMSDVDEYMQEDIYRLAGTSS